MVIHFVNGRAARGDLLVGADVIHSVVRGYVVGPGTTPQIMPALTTMPSKPSPTIHHAKATFNNRLAIFATGEHLARRTGCANLRKSPAGRCTQSAGSPPWAEARDFS